MAVQQLYSCGGQRSEGLRYVCICTTKARQSTDRTLQEMRTKCVSACASNVNQATHIRASLAKRVPVCHSVIRDRNRQSSEAQTAAVRTPAGRQGRPLLQTVTARAGVVCVQESGTRGRNQAPWWHGPTTPMAKNRLKPTNPLHKTPDDSQNPKRAQHPTGQKPRGPRAPGRHWTDPPAC